MEYREFDKYKIYEDGTIINDRGMELKQNYRHGGREIKLVTPRGRKSFIVSRLVYCVFNNIDIEFWDKNMCVIAKDNDLTNCHINNLMVKPRKDIIQGEKHRNRTSLSQTDVDMIKELYANNPPKPTNQYDITKEYYSYQRLADIFGVTKGNIRAIINGQSWNKDKYKL